MKFHQQFPRLSLMQTSPRIGGPSNTGAAAELAVIKYD